MARGSWFEQLKSLEVWGCYMMEQVLLWNEEENQTNIHIPLVFPKLKTLKLLFLPRLTSFSKGIFQSVEFPLLEEVEVVSCPLQSFVFTACSTRSPDDDDSRHLFGELDKVKFGSLKVVQLEILDEGRNSNCCPQIPIDFFDELRNLKLSGFKSLKSLFSLSMTESSCLLQLEELEIEKCDMMEQVLLWNEEENQTNIHIPLVFPKLKKLELCSLPRLTSFSKGIFQSVEFPLLEEMKVVHCPLQSFVFNACSTRSPNDDDSRHLFGELDKESCVSTSTSLTGPPHDNDDSMYLFCKTNEVEFGNLKELRISHYDSMRNWCGQISIDFFAVLCKLEVSSLKGMKSLFTCSIARNLRNLVWLRINDCEEMVKVIGDEEDDALQISLFPNLKRLYLWNLEKLKCLCEWRCTLQLPKLEHLSIRGCDVMDEFTLGDLNTPNLETIRIDYQESGNEVNKALQQRRLKREKQLEMQLEESSAEADSTN